MINTQSSVISYNQIDVSISGRDREILRNLAERMAELSAHPIQEKKRDLWFRHNALEATRPVIFCDPENGWNEIITRNQYQCEGNLALQWENMLRKEIFWGEAMGDDRVIEPFFYVPYVFAGYIERGWGMDPVLTGGENGGAYTWDAPLKDYGNLDQLHFPQITVDSVKSEQIFQLAQEVLGDLLEVKRRTKWWHSLGMTRVLIKLRGLEQSMFDMYDHPEELHRLMAFLRDGHLAYIDFLEGSGLLHLNNNDTYVGSGGFGYTNELPKQYFNSRQVRTADMWGFCESQEMVSLSPAMFKEFVFQYQLPIMKRFGLNCYGCCEPLNQRWDIVKEIPGLRRVSVSAWADLEDMADKLGDKYVYSMKPNPSYLATPLMDEEYIRKSLREFIKMTRNCRVEIIMKDNHTLGNNPDNVIRWCRIAREEAERI